MRSIVLGLERVGGRDVERQLVLGDGRDPQLARERLRDEAHDVRVDLAVLDVEHRHLELLGERRDEVVLADDAGVQQHVADPRPRAVLLAQGGVDLLVGDDAVGDEQVADARRVGRRRGRAPRSSARAAGRRSA